MEEFLTLKVSGHVAYCHIAPIDLNLHQISFKSDKPQKNLSWT